MTFLCQRHVSKKALAHTPWLCGKQFKKPSSKINKSTLFLNHQPQPLYSTACCFRARVGRAVAHILASKKSVAFEGIWGRLPAAPYAYSGLHSKWQISPFFMVATPMSHALITWPKRKRVEAIGYTLANSIISNQVFSIAIPLLFP